MYAIGLNKVKLRLVTTHYHYLSAVSGARHMYSPPFRNYCCWVFHVSYDISEFSSLASSGS